MVVQIGERIFSGVYTPKYAEAVSTLRIPVTTLVVIAR